MVDHHALRMECYLVSVSFAVAWTHYDIFIISLCFIVQAKSSTGMIKFATHAGLHYLYDDFGAECATESAKLD